MTDILKNKWKVMTFGLLGFILVGAILPQATATTDVTQLTQQILNIVKSPIYGNQAIMNAINGLQSSSASSSSVSNLQTTVNYIQGNMTELKTKVDNLAANQGKFKILGPFGISAFDGQRNIYCTSDAPYKLYVHERDDPDNDLDHLIVNGWNYYGNADYDFVYANNANQGTNIYDYVVGDTGAFAIVTMETAVGATASCTVS